jgi:hypothetical protein
MNQGTRCVVVALLALVATLHAPQVIADGAPPTAAGAGRIDLLLRTYAEDLLIDELPARHALVESARLEVTPAPIALVPDVLDIEAHAAAYGAIRLEGKAASGNMVHRHADGSGWRDDSWAYLGEATLKAGGRLAAVRVGLQAVSNPFLSPYDIRALPPSFRGVSAEGRIAKDTTWSAGSFDGVIVRGDDRVRELATAYTGLPVPRVDYAGVDLQRGAASMTLYASRSRELWTQVYASIDGPLFSAGSVAVSGSAAGYAVRARRDGRAGDASTNGVSASWSANRGASTMTLGLQAILGDAFLDYTGETAGLGLSNSMVSDYNGPRERSVQLRYAFDGDAVGLAGWRLATWLVRGFGSDGRMQAGAHPLRSDPLHGVYWSGDVPMHGHQTEWSLKSTYTVQSGFAKDAVVSLQLYVTDASARYYSPSLHGGRFEINVPVHVL